ncbi:MAG TPA: hypothetical protein ACFYD6_13985 [Candidatus Brocadiia bacterium]|nr:hypothetical protein [Planctomycetota bacterium]MDO8093949.1 hypothetical protein [Candidatus Brocadiales bacterium]
MRLLAILIGFFILVNILFAYDFFVWSKRNLDIVEDFQQLVCGVGMGASKTPTWCYINFDERIEPVCTCIEWPIPGGYCYCPDHSGTVSFFKGDAKNGALIEIPVFEKVD